MKWVIVGLLLFVLAITFNLSLMVYALYAIVAILLVTRWVTRNWTQEVVASRDCDREVAAIGDELHVTIDLQNRGRWPITWMLAEDLIPPEHLAFNPPPLDVRGDRLKVLKLAAGQKHQMRYSFECNRRGYYQIGPLVLETGDMFGLNRRFRVLSEPSYLTVHPATVPLEAYDIASRRPIGEVVITHRLFEDPTRIAGVRQYQQGDALGRVHWRATARTGTLQSKIYEPSTLSGATIVVDFHRQSFDRKHEPVRSELAITAAASIAQALHEMGLQVGIVSNGRDAVDRIRSEGWRGDNRTRDEARNSASMLSASNRLRPVVVKTQKSPDQMLRILDTLARLELTDGLNLSQLLTESADELPRDATVIVIVSAVRMETAVALGSLRRQGYSVTAIVNNYLDEEFAQVSGPLLAEGITTRHLKDESSIRAICQNQMLA